MITEQEQKEIQEVKDFVEEFEGFKERTRQSFEAFLDYMGVSKERIIEEKKEIEEHLDTLFDEIFALDKVRIRSINKLGDKLNEC